MPSSSFLRPTLIVASLALLTAPGAGAGPDGDSRASLRLSAPAPAFDAVDQGRRVRPRLEGFGFTARPGEPMLPLKILLVAIPEGAVPRLEVRSERSTPLGHMSLAPVPRLGNHPRKETNKALASVKERSDGPETDGVVSEDDLDFAPDQRVYATDREFPGPPVRLGTIGYLREQRFVEVLFTPVLYNPASGQARYVGEIQADVHFDTPAGRPIPLTKGVFRPDPEFEDTYRTSLVNYEQGKLFRVGPGEATPESSAASRLAPESLAVAAAGTPRYKVSVSTTGVYRLDYSYLQLRAPDLLTLDPRTFLLSAEGTEVPISIRNAAGASGEADGHLDPGDFIEFFGRRKVEAPTIANSNLPDPFPDIYQANDFTDTQVYWLESAPGPHLRTPSLSGAPQSPALPLATDFESTAVWDENNVYLPLGDADPFFSIPSLLAGSTQTQRDLTLPLPGIAPVAATARVRLRLRSGSGSIVSPDHRTQAWINGHSSRGTDFTWDGDVIEENEFTAPQSDLLDPTTIHVQLPGVPDVTVDLQYLDTVTIVYRRLFSAQGDVLMFTYPNQDARFTVGGFGGAAPTIYDITRTLTGSDEANPVRITGAAVSGSPVFTYTFDVPRDASPTAPAMRSYIVVGPSGVRQPEDMTRAADPVLRDPTLAADYLVIASRDTVDVSPGGSLQALLNHRLVSQGLTSRIVYIDQIYDEFAFGLRNPNAIRSFLSYVYDNWRGPGGTARPLSYVLIVGDSSLDYKNTLVRTDWVDQVPAPIMFSKNSFIGYYSSDNWLASFRGSDQVPDAHLGRISTRSAGDSALVFDKILRYEQTPPPGLWKGRAVLMTSEGKPPNAASEADSFIAVQDVLTSRYFSAPPYSVPSPPLYNSRPPWDTAGPTAFHDAMVSELNNGAAILSFVGHGAFDVWGLSPNTFFTTQDAFDLRNDGPLPFMVNINCLSGGFHYLLGTGAIGEGMTNNPYGGAIASFAPSGLTYFFDIGDVFNDQLFGTIFGPTGERVLGPASTQLRMALWSGGKIIDLQGFTFLGDPATVLATPAPPPPTGLTASAGNGQVSLSWTPASVPVAGTRIYRASSSPTAPYAPVSCDPVSTSSCIDNTVLNASTYYYYAVSIDAEGFSGRASNFNSDCDAGPDCVVARPINPGPPSVPTGLTSHDTGTGGVLQVSWQANPERDVSSYTLRYGSSPGQYTAQVTVAAGITTKILTGLIDGTRYYMALSATNTSGKQSALSAEISDVPHLIQGISPPRAISDLQLARSDNDLALSWSRPTLDIYGRPTTVVRYDVYRSSSVNFIPSAATRIVSILNGSTTTYRDVNALLLAGNSYYLVTATDGAGLVSGAGRELPNGIGGLSVSVPAVGRIHLAWSAVTTDVQGYATIIDHYQVHQSATPLARGSLGPSTLVDNVQGLSVDLTVPGAPQFFSVIAVDNRGNLSPF